MIKSFFLSILIAIPVCISFPANTYAVNINESNKLDLLLGKVAKDYTRKFCNGIGFGLSKDSAMVFALKENSQAFAKKNGIDNLNEDSLAELIAVSVIDKCGYPIALSGEKGVQEFKDFYLENKIKFKLR